MPSNSGRKRIWQLNRLFGLRSAAVDCLVHIDVARRALQTTAAGPDDAVDIVLNRALHDGVAVKHVHRLRRALGRNVGDFRHVRTSHYATERG
jgi:hypothetical protein